MNIRVERKGGEWVVVFGFGVQSFHLESLADTKKEALWFARMLRICFESYGKDLEKKILEKPNGMLRSAHEVAKRKGQNTNWGPFRRQLMKELKREHRIMYPKK